MSLIADKLKSKAKEPEKAPEKEEQLILGLLIPVKLKHRGKEIKGYLNLHPDAVYSGHIGIALDEALAEANGQLDLNAYEPRQYGGSSYSGGENGGYSKGSWRR